MDSTTPQTMALAPASFDVWLPNVQYVVKQYRAYWPLTVRQVFFRMVTSYDYPKAQADYEALTALVWQARHTGQVPWDAIREEERSPVLDLTAREREVLMGIAQGQSNEAIATDLVISKRAVEKHVNLIFWKLGLSTDDKTISKRVKAALMFLDDEAARPVSPSQAVRVRFSSSAF